MEKFTNKLIILITLSIFSIISPSCDIDNEPTIPENGQTSQDRDNGGNNSNKYVNYYFRVETQVGNIRPEAGELNISIDCNQEWSVSYSGDISGFSYTPSKGKGRGIITLRFDQVNYNETATEFKWNESGTLTFYIREGNSKNFKNTTYNVYFNRRGSKMKV